MIRKILRHLGELEDPPPVGYAPKKEGDKWMIMNVIWQTYPSE